MIKRKRGEWVPSEASPETQKRRLFAKFKLEKEGTATKEVLAHRLRREQQTAQPRKATTEVLSIPRHRILG